MKYLPDLESAIRFLDELSVLSAAVSNAHQLSELLIRKFAVAADLADNNVCGGFDGQFGVSIKVSVLGLDERGFVTHNEELMEAVRDAFDPNRGMLKASCEELGAGVVNVVHRIVGDRLINVSARIYNRFGHVDTVWSPSLGIPLPAFPRLATLEEI